MLDSQQFEAAVNGRLGPGLQQATYANVREFIAWYNEATDAAPIEMGRYLLGVEGDVELGVEQAVKRFLGDCLAGPAEQSRQRLWVASLEMWFAVLESFDQEQRPGLLGDLDQAEPDGR